MLKSIHQTQVPPTPSEEQELRIYLLGGFRVSLGQRTIDEGQWRLRKARGLIKLLALAPDHRLHREQVMDLLWPDLEPGPAANNLRKIVHIVRRTLETNFPSRVPPTRRTKGKSASNHSRFLQLDSESIVLRPTRPLWVDVEAFESAAATARQSKEPQAYRAAIELYTGDLLPEDRYEDWAIERREELRATYADLLLKLAHLHQEGGEYEPAIEALKQVVAGDPLHDQAHTELMRLYVISGERRQALRQYRQLKDALRRELDVEPEEATTRLYEEIVAAPPTPPSTTQVRKHNLPAQLTSFIGRRKEIAEVKRLLSSTRLLTLTGPGGCGKTRLAIQIAFDLLEQYPDGIWLVELASLADPALVPQAVASALAIREQSGRSLTDTLVSFLEVKKCLLIFDNCEHLIEASAALAETLLRRCSELEILATSREPLNIPGETAWTVPSLSLPERGSPQSLDSLGHYEATRLFIDRAMTVLPSFTPTDRDAPVIARICSQLDGVPLAIELAAARVKVLTLEQIAERLSDSFRWLGEGSRTAAPRHQTLSATIGWSYNLLPGKEQALFRRLSVFAGGFTLEAVETVCTGGVIEQQDVLDLLSHLVDKSLVRVPSEPGEQGYNAEVRYLLLETLRQYGRERLEDNGEVESTEHRHANYYRALVERAEPEVRGPQQVAWLELLDRELDNLRAARDWSQRMDAATGLSIVGNLWQFWEIRGYHTEGRRWLAGLLPRAPARTLARAKALNCAAVLAMRHGEAIASEQLLSECLSIFEEVGDQEGLAGALERSGLLKYGLGDYAESRRLLLESAALFQKLNNIQGMGWALSDLGMVARIQGDYEVARAAFEESVTYLREWDDKRGLAYILNNLGQLMRVEGNYSRAHTLLEESLAVAREVGDKPFTSWALMCLGEVARRQGNLARARSCFIEGLHIAGDVGYERHISTGLGALGVLDIQEGEYQRGVRLMGAAVALQNDVRASLDIDEKISWDESLIAARDELGEAAFAAAWTEGQSMILSKSQATLSTEGDGKQIATLRPRKVGIEGVIEYAQEET